MDLSKLMVGEKVRLKGFSDPEISLKLIELGFVPGVELTYIRKAPFGDPIVVMCSGALISLRKAEAKTVIVESIESI